MALPPLQSVPHLERLLAPGEQIIYTAKIHPLHGGLWLFGGLAFLVAGYFWWPLVIPALPLLVIYSLPFKTNELAVTTHRLLLRKGRFQLHMEGIPADHLEDWHLDHSLVESFFHCGTVRVAVREHRNLRNIIFTRLWHPMTFLEALETLQSCLRNGTTPPQDKA